MPERKIHDERHKIARRRGNGLLRREIWVDERGRVTRYNLAFINPALFAGDNGRVLGYDNQHGEHHRHCRGTCEPYAFTSFLKLEERFQAEWVALLAERQGKG
jgi:hypothetical protein